MAKTITATVTFEYDFTDQIQMVNDDRAQDGEPPMTDKEIEEWIKDDLNDFDFRETVGDLDDSIEVKFSEPENDQ